MLDFEEKGRPWTPFYVQKEKFSLNLVNLVHF